MAKGKGFAAEFKKFIMRGNVIDLAVGVIIGGAFQAIVKSLVDDIIMPVVGLATKGIDFTNWFIALDGNKYETLELAKEAGAATLNFGSFISAILNFLIMALIIFIFVKAINTVAEKARKPEAPAEPTTKKCPYCKSEISIEATRCPNCTSQLEEAE
ncbi:MAG: large conductance mechanosensitive channel protein MscL [Oscillospiraceae bacterium]|nr:large conductance mechanosensitive channel protein MscL [Oscillospiraceae bacterium]